MPQPTVSPLSSNNSAAYTDLVHGPATPEQRAQRIERLEGLLAERHPSTENILLLLDAAGEVRAAIKAFPYGASAYTLSSVLARPDDIPPVDDLSTLVGAAVEHLRSQGAAAVSTRLPHSPLNDAVQQALHANGFRRVGERVEFTAPLDALPSDEGSPLRWLTMEEVGLEGAAAMMGRCSVGDPHTDPTEEPRAALLELLSDTALQSSPNCVQIGLLDDERVAFVMAQAKVGGGWARITYIGVVPEQRGRGVGRWAHRHGFAMMREQGGTEYHGGTATDNAAMVRLFESHNCTEKGRMVEWEHRLTE